MKYRGTTKLTHNAVGCCGSRHPLISSGLQCTCLWMFVGIRSFTCPW